jgi:hypothetical protein
LVRNCFDGGHRPQRYYAFFLSAKNDIGVLFADPTRLLLIGSSGANWFHWSMVFDLVAYLCFAPIAVFGYSWFRAQRPNLVLLVTPASAAALLGHTVEVHFSTYLLESGAAGIKEAAAALGRVTGIGGQGRAER